MARVNRDIIYTTDMIRDYAKKLQKGDKVYFNYKTGADIAKEWHGFVVSKYRHGATVSFKLPKAKKPQISFFSYKELLLRDRAVYDFSGGDDIGFLGRQR